MSRAVVAVGLTATWVALWQDASIGTVLAGALVSVAVIIAVPESRSLRWAVSLRPLATLRFLGAFGVNLAHATWDVAWDVMTPTIYVREGIVAVPLDTRSQAIVTLIANAVSVTPGTVTVDIDHPRTLYIHVMHLRDVESSKREVKRLEELAVRAFGSEDDLARLDGRRDRR